MSLLCCLVFFPVNIHPQLKLTAGSRSAHTHTQAPGLGSTSQENNQYKSKTHLLNYVMLSFDYNNIYIINIE